MTSEPKQDLDTLGKVREHFLDEARSCEVAAQYDTDADEWIDIMRPTAPVIEPVAFQEFDRDEPPDFAPLPAPPEVDQ
jgi:hypothetical protein